MAKTPFFTPYFFLHFVLFSRFYYNLSTFYVDRWSAIRHVCALQIRGATTDFDICNAQSFDLFRNNYSFSKGDWKYLMIIS